MSGKILTDSAEPTNGGERCVCVWQGVPHPHRYSTLKSFWREGMVSSVIVSVPGGACCHSLHAIKGWWLGTA